MSAPRISRTLDRYTEIGELCDKARHAIKRLIMPTVVVLVLESVHLAYSGQVGAGAFALMCLGTCVSLQIWSQDAIGLPLLPMMVIQSLIIYGVPIAAGHENILTYPPNFVFQAGVEVMIFDLAMIVGWKSGMQMFHPAPPISHALQEFNKTGVKGWSKLGFTLVVTAGSIQVLQGLEFAGPLFGALPAGSSSILYALLSVASACGFFLISMVIGGNEASPVERSMFWILLVANGMISASGFLLAAAAANLFTVAIGFFWSNGRVPWRYLTVAMLTLSFLNTGKYTMRLRYWATEEGRATDVSPTQMPAVYAEWIQASFDAIVENKVVTTPSASETVKAGNKNQTLLDRLDNLQNELFIIDAIQAGHAKPLDGATYTLIPPLLVPRILWPDKPRTHEGQILLNVHFGRQDIDSTFTTYVAWGLLPEAYANFGRVLGSVFLGGIMGLAFAWIENFSARKLVVSMEGFLALNILMSLMNSFEMVASIFITSTFQSLIVIGGASIPFVHRTVHPQRTHDGS